MKIVYVVAEEVYGTVGTLWQGKRVKLNTFGFYLFMKNQGIKIIVSYFVII